MMNQVLEKMKAAIPSGSLLEKLWKLFNFMTGRMVEHQVTGAAAALSYSTALATVPALALVAAMLAAFPAFSSVRAGIQEFIFANVLPDTGIRMEEQLAGFVEAAGKVTAFGVAGLALASIFLLLTIESAFNRIFRVVRPRLLRMRLLVLWAVVTVGPLLLGVSFSLAGYVTFSESFTATAAGAVLLGRVVPTVIAWMALTFIYVMVPNRRVRLKDAAIGAGVAALLMAALRYGFAIFVGTMTSYQAVYGAVAAVPVFLIWVYANWITVLAGAVITASLPDWRHAPFSVDTGAGLALALEVICRLAAAQKEGLGISSERLAILMRVQDTAMAPVFEVLRAGRFIAATDDGRWILSRDLDRTPLADLVHHFGMGLVEVADELKDSPMGRSLTTYMQRAAESERTLLSVSLARVVAGPDEDDKPKT